jgi:integrating conjugative element protein (TIGR03749 family)
MMLSVVAAAALAASSPSKLIWDDVPLGVSIPVSQETVLRVPEPVEIGVPPELAAKLRVESIKNVVLLKPNAAFEQGRLVLRAIGSNQVYLIDVTASANSNADRYELIAPKAITQTVGLGSAPVEDVRIALTRFASREFFAPQRLRGGLSAVRVPVSLATVALYRGHAVRATPQASWSYANHFVTAVELLNLTPDTRELDPRQLRGDWLTATVQHTSLAPAGQSGERTLVYLVSARPFEACQ